MVSVRRLTAGRTQRDLTECVCSGSASDDAGPRDDLLL
jgi:hypothetical protein